MRLRLIAYLVALGLLAGMGWSQSLGDVARQQRDGKKAKRVITDDDMPARAPSQPEPASPSASSAAPDATASKDAGTKPAAGAQGKEQDKETQAALKRIDELKQSEAAEKRIVDKFEKSLADNPSDFRREMIEDSLRTAKRQLETFSQERQQLEQKTAAPGQAKAQQASGK
jgi:hypothetical protein